MNTVIITLTVSLLVLLQSDTVDKNSTVEIIKAIGGVIAIIGGILSPIILFYVNKMNAKVIAVATEVKGVASKVDGLMDEKTLADKALGRIEGIDTAAKEKAIGDDRELKILKEQQLLNQTPPNRDTRSDVKDVKDEIVKTLETEIKKKGDEIQKVVEKEGDDIKDGVEKIPDEVVKKLPPS